MLAPVSWVISSLCIGAIFGIWQKSFTAGGFMVVVLIIFFNLFLAVIECLCGG